MRRILFFVLIIISFLNCQTLFITQYDITYSYSKNGETVTEEQSFLWYVEKPGCIEGKLTNNKHLIADYQDIKVEKILKYEIKL